MLSFTEFLEIDSILAADQYLNEYTILSERYVSLIGNDPRKDKYKNQVHELIQDAYKKIGVPEDWKTPDSCVHNAEYWKLNIVDGHVRSVNLYKDSNGRKRIASASDGTKEGKTAMLGNPDKEFDRSYVEISGGALAFLMRNHPQIAMKWVIPIEKVKEHLKGKEIHAADQASMEWKKYPQLHPYLYSRSIGSLGNHTKVMFGSAGIPIKTLHKI